MATQRGTLSSSEGRSLALFVRALRERALLTQEELARRSGLSVGTVRGLESGRIRRPRSDSVRLLADALALSEQDRTVFASLARGEGDLVVAGPTRPTQAGVLPAMLPPAVAGFTGRTEALKLLDEALPPVGASSSPVVISAIGGTPGVGKTALAVYWAHQVRNRFPDGQLYVNLRGFDPGGTPVNSAEAVRGFLDALGVPAQRTPTGLDAQAGLYRSLLADRRLLVVLDNARDAEQVRPLLPGSAGCLVLVTSRSQLSSLVAAEGARLLILEPPTDGEARDLLARRLGPDRVAAEPHAVADLIGYCARLPLALAIVAARATANPSFSLAALAGQLRETGDRLDALQDEDPIADVRAVFSWSYQTLTVRAARLFRLLGLHRGPDIGAPAAASLAAVSPSRARQLLSELARAHLIAEHSPGRYTFHDLLRAYATEMAHGVDDEAESGTALHRVLDHYLHTAHEAARQLMPTREPLALTPHQDGVTPESVAGHEQATAWFTTERAVLMAAVDEAAVAGFDAHAHRLAWTLQDFLDGRGHWQDLAASQDVALQAAARLGDSTGQAYAHRGLARAYFRTGRHDDSLTQLRCALDRYQDIGDLVGQADTTRTLGMVLWHMDRGRGREVLDYALRAVDLYPEDGPPAGRARGLNDAGWCFAQLGEYEQARTYCERALALQQQVRDVRGQASTWDSLGYIQRQLGRHHEAIACYEQALRLFRDLDDHYYQAETLMNLGDTQHTSGDPLAARDVWKEALRILTALDHPDADAVRARLAKPRRS